MQQKLCIKPSYRSAVVTVLLGELRETGDELHVFPLNLSIMPSSQQVYSMTSRLSATDIDNASITTEILCRCVPDSQDVFGSRSRYVK